VRDDHLARLARRPFAQRAGRGLATARGFAQLGYSLVHGRTELPPLVFVGLPKRSDFSEASFERVGDAT